MDELRYEEYNKSLELGDRHEEYEEERERWEYDRCVACENARLVDSSVF